MQLFLDFISRYTQIAEEERDKIISIIEYSSHAKGDIIQKQGAINDKMTFILSGAVRSYYKDKNGLEHTTGFTFENNGLASIENFSYKIPSPIEEIALEPTELIYTSHDKFFAFLQLYPKYESVLREVVNYYNLISHQRARLLRIPSAKDRYQEFCLQVPEAIQRVPLKYIASYLEMAVETISRIRAGKA